MSDWTYIDTSFGNDGKPQDALLAVDSLRTNTQAEIDQSSHMADWPAPNGLWTTTSATYSGKSIRLPPLYVPSADSMLVVRRYKWVFWAKVSSGAQTGVIRVFGGTRFAVPSDVAEDDFVTVESSGISSTSYVERTVTLSLQRAHTFGSTDGLAPDEPERAYRATCMGVQGKCSGGATLTIWSAGPEAINP